MARHPAGVTLASSAREEGLRKQIVRHLASLRRQYRHLCTQDLTTSAVELFGGFVEPLLDELGTTIRLTADLRELPGLSRTGGELALAFGAALEVLEDGLAFILGGPGTS